MTKTEALQQRKELLKLINEWTRAETIARHGKFENKGFTNYAEIKIEKVDEIRRLVFGTDDLLVLGVRWGILDEKSKN